MKVKALLRQYDLQPRKSLGQNFLHDEGVAARILAAARLSPSDHVLEVGPGLGILTQGLAQHAAHVVAIELDDRLVQVLRKTLAHLPNVEVLHGDILQANPEDLIPSGVPYKVVANLPYYITSAVTRHVLEATIRPRLLVIMVQREVAERMTAGPGDMSLLAVSVQYYGAPRLVARVRSGAFYPRPEVDSAIVRIDVHDELPAYGDTPDQFFRVVKAGFSQRRKQIRNSLSSGLSLDRNEVASALEAHGLDEKRRPQTFSVEEWGEVCEAMLPLLAHQSAKRHP